MVHSVYILKKHLLVGYLLLVFSVAIWAQNDAKEVESVDSPFNLYNSMVEDFYRLTKAEGAKWQETIDKLDQERVSELEWLKSNNNYDYHSQLLTDYHNASLNYLKFLKNLKQNTEQKFSPYGLSEKQVGAVVDNLLSLYKVQKDTLINLLDVHLKYSAQMQSYISLLERYKNEWYVEKGELATENSLMIKEYNELIDVMIVSDNKVLELTQKLNRFTRQ